VLWGNLHLRLKINGNEQHLTTGYIIEGPTLQSMLQASTVADADAHFPWQPPFWGSGAECWLRKRRDEIIWGSLERQPDSGTAHYQQAAIVGQGDPSNLPTSIQFPDINPIPNTKYKDRSFTLFHQNIPEISSQLSKASYLQLSLVSFFLVPAAPSCSAVARCRSPRCLTSSLPMSDEEDALAVSRASRCWSRSSNSSSWRAGH